MHIPVCPLNSVYLIINANMFQIYDSLYINLIDISISHWFKLYWQIIIKIFYKAKNPVVRWWGLILNWLHVKHVLYNWATKAVCHLVIYIKTVDYLLKKNIDVIKIILYHIGSLVNILILTALYSLTNKRFYYTQLFLPWNWNWK